jgi:hypothetical protein
MKRREFVRTLSAAGVALYASDLVGDLVAQSPRGQVLQSRFKGLSDIALGDATRLGCTYADIRFTRNVNDSVAVRDKIVTDSFGFGAARGERRFWRPRHPQWRGDCQQPDRHRGRNQEVTARHDVAKASAQQALR